jgi:hypothetical protein
MYSTYSLHVRKTAVVYAGPKIGRGWLEAGWDVVGAGFIAGMAPATKGIAAAAATAAMLSVKIDDFLL